jgi:hypothetical protein
MWEEGEGNEGRRMWNEGRRRGLRLGGEIREG